MTYDLSDLLSRGLRGRAGGTLWSSIFFDALRAFQYCTLVDEHPILCSTNIQYFFEVRYGMRAAIAHRAFALLFTYYLISQALINEGDFRPDQ